MKGKKKEYTVKYKNEGKTTARKFNNVKEARGFGLEKYREGSFISFHNINKIPLCL